MKSQVIISIDFDGTLVTNDFPKIGKPAPYAIEVIKKLQEKGVKFILLTMRDNDHYCDPVTGKCKDFYPPSRTDVKTCLEDAVNYCKENGINLWGINRNPIQYKFSSSRKVYANIYIDDQAFGIPITYVDDFKEVVDWKKIGEYFGVLD